MEAIQWKRERRIANKESEGQVKQRVNQAKQRGQAGSTKPSREDKKDQQSRG